MISRRKHNKMHNTPLFKNSSIYLLGLLTWAVVIVQALATSPHNSFSRNGQWGISRGGSLASQQRASSSLKSLAEDSNEVKANEEANASTEIPHIQPVNGVNNKEHESKIFVDVNIPNGAADASSKPTAKKTIVTPGGFADTLLPATYVAETNLPTDIGHYRIRAYRIENPSDGEHPLGAGAGLGSEPCIIYCTDKPPFGERDGKGAQGVPVRIHDQCFTSEVFRSKR